MLEPSSGTGRGEVAMKNGKHRGSSVPLPGRMRRRVLPAALLAMVALYVIVRYVIVKPLKHLRDVSDEVSRGGFSPARPSRSTSMISLKKSRQSMPLALRILFALWRAASIWPPRSSVSTPTSCA